MRCGLLTERALLGALMVLAAGLGGCAKPKLIPNTQVLDTATNREVLEVVENYRRAMERLDAVGVLALVHPTYQDTAGTPQASDDIDYSRLREFLTSRFKRTTRIRYRIEYQDVRLNGTQAEVDSYIDATFVYQEPNANAKWRRLTDYNRFTLHKDGALWRFVSGL